MPSLTAREAEKWVGFTFRLWGNGRHIREGTQMSAIKRQSSRLKAKEAPRTNANSDLGIIFLRKSFQPFFFFSSYLGFIVFVVVLLFFYNVKKKKILNYF